MINLVIYYHILYPIINIDKINITSMQIIIFMLVVCNILLVYWVMLYKKIR